MYCSSLPAPFHAERLSSSLKVDRERCQTKPVIHSHGPVEPYTSEAQASDEQGPPRGERHVLNQLCGSQVTFGPSLALSLEPCDSYSTAWRGAKSYDFDVDQQWFVVDLGCREVGLTHLVLKNTGNHDKENW